MTEKTTVLIADDQELFADALRGIIESRATQFKVVGVAGNGAQAIEMAHELNPDIVLMDIRMPGIDGVEATRRIHNRDRNTKILILTTFSDDEYVYESLAHGAIGYLLKNRPVEELINSLKALSGGIMQIDPVVSQNLLRQEREAKRGDNENNELLSRLRTLSRRERQVLQLMLEARRIVAIAEELNIAEQTVRNHVSNLYSKLGIHDRMEIVNYVDVIRNFLREGD